MRTAVLGSLWVVAFTALVSFPLGVGAAIYLEEYATDNRLNRLIQTNISNLAGVPSIIYGMLGLAVFVRALEVITSGTAFGAVAAGATAVIQPGGSMRDEEVIAAADEAGLAMVFTGMRHFRH